VFYIYGSCIFIFLKKTIIKTSKNGAKTMKNGNADPCPYKDGLV